MILLLLNNLNKAGPVKTSEALRKTASATTKAVRGSWKTVFAFAALVVANIAQTTATEVDGKITNIELPNTQSEWVTLVITSVGGAALVWFKQNYSEDKPDDSPPKV